MGLLRAGLRAFRDPSLYCSLTLLDLFADLSARACCTDSDRAGQHLPAWHAVRARDSPVLGNAAQAKICGRCDGVNAAVVGLLAGALYDPVWVTSVRDLPDFALALADLIMLVVWRAPPVLVVVLTALGGAALASL